MEFGYVTSKAVAESGIRISAPPPIPSIAAGGGDAAQTGSVVVAADAVETVVVNHVRRVVRGTRKSLSKPRLSRGENPNTLGTNNNSRAHIVVAIIVISVGLTIV
jgi:hypothetical protein